MQNLHEFQALFSLNIFFILWEVFSFILSVTHLLPVIFLGKSDHSRIFSLIFSRALKPLTFLILNYWLQCVSLRTFWLNRDLGTYEKTSLGTLNIYHRSGKQSKTSIHRIEKNLGRHIVSTIESKFHGYRSYQC